MKAVDPIFSIFRIWLPGRAVWVSIDAYGLCSPEVFCEFGAPYLQPVIDHFGAGWIHLHSADARLLPQIVKLKNILGIGLIDDPNAPRGFDLLPQVRQITGDIPLQIDCSGAELARGLAKGAYILADSDGRPDLIIIATGSEVHVALAAGKELALKGISARVVSMPSQELFEETSREYQESLLPKDVTARIAVEAGSPMGWERYVGEKGRIIGISRFGASAPGGTLMKQYGITAENVIQQAVDLLG